MSNDTISRSALEKYMNDYRWEFCMRGDFVKAIEMVDCAPAVETGPKWISVEERLPDSQTDVLVVAFWHECWQTMIGWHSDDGKKWRVLTSHGEREPGGVTHWMPLLEPPKEG